MDNENYILDEIQDVIIHDKNNRLIKITGFDKDSTFEIRDDNGIITNNLNLKGDCKFEFI